MAFIAAEAGAVISDEHGAEIGSFRESPERTIPFIVASANMKTHTQILRLLEA